MLFLPSLVSVFTFYPQQKKVIVELALSRQGFEEMLLAKNKELEVTKVGMFFTLLIIGTHAIC